MWVTKKQIEEILNMLIVAPLQPKAHICKGYVLTTDENIASWSETHSLM